MQKYGFLRVIPIGKRSSALLAESQMLASPTFMWDQDTSIYKLVFDALSYFQPSHVFFFFLFSSLDGNFWADQRAGIEALGARVGTASMLGILWSFRY